MSRKEHRGRIMKQDKNADKRSDYNLKINDNERKVESLQQAQQQELRMLERFQQEKMNFFRNVIAIEEAVSQHTGKTNAFSETEQERQYVQHVFARREEDLQELYSTEKEALEDEREVLQQERNDLAWE